MPSNGFIGRTDRLTAFKSISKNTGGEGRNIGCVWSSVWNRQADRFTSFHRLLRLNDDSFDGISIRNWYDICNKAVDGLLNCNSYQAWGSFISLDCVIRTFWRNRWSTKDPNISWGSVLCQSEKNGFGWRGWGAS